MTTFWIGIGLILVSAGIVFILSMCRAAAKSDEQEEKAFKEYLENTITSGSPVIRN